MYRSWFILILNLSLSRLAVGQGPPVVEFVEGLRARNMPDLALEYLHRISETAPPELRERITLEIAKVNFDLAMQESDEIQQSHCSDQAERAFEKYIAATGDSIASADANVDLARLITQRARLKLITSRHLATDGMAARTAFDAALGHMRQAIEKLNAANQMNRQPQIINRIGDLQIEEHRIRLFRAATLEDEARWSELEKIHASLDSLAADHDGQPIGWLAKVLIGRCWLERDHVMEARKQLDEIAIQGGKVAPEALRLNRYYQVVLLSREAVGRTPDVVRSCEEWLTTYRPFENSEEGQGIRILLAKALLSQAIVGEPPIALSPGTRATLLRADRAVRGMDNRLGVYSLSARAIRGDIAQLLVGEQSTFDISKIGSFAEAHLMGQGMANSAWRVAAGLDRTARFRRAAQVLEHGLKIASVAESAQEIVEAELMLAYLHLACGDHYAAAVLGEYISQTNPNRRGAQGLAYAISAYANILAEARANSAAAKRGKSDEIRLQRAVQLMLMRWPNDPASDVARFNLGLLHLESRRYSEAFAAFMAIRDAFVGSRDARWRAGVVARMVQAPDVTIDAAVKATMLSQAVQGLRKINLQPDSGDEQVIVGTCEARLELGRLLLLTERMPATYVEIRCIGEGVQSAVNERLSDTHLSRPRLGAEAELLVLCGVIGESYLLMQKGQFEEVLASLSPRAETIEQSVKNWAQSPNMHEAWFQQLLSVRRDLILLYLRACSNRGQIGRIAASLACLRSMPPMAGVTNHQPALLQIASELQRDLEVARASKNESREKGLVAGLAAIIGEFKRADELSVDQRILLAQASSAIHRHDQAMTILTTIPEAHGDSREAQSYRFARIALARESRRAGDYPRAKTVLREMLGTPAKKGWAFDNVEARKEAIALMHDEKNWAGGNRMAVEMQQRLLHAANEFAEVDAKLRSAHEGNRTNDIPSLEAKMQQLKPAREAFLEFYFLELQGIVKAAADTRDEKSKALLDRVAKRMAKLELSYPDLGGVALRQQFRELMQSESELKSKYASEGGKLLAEK